MTNKFKLHLMTFVADVDQRLVGTLRPFVSIQAGRDIKKVLYRPRPNGAEFKIRGCLKIRRC